MQQIIESLNRLQCSIVECGFTGELEFYVEPSLYVSLNHQVQSMPAYYDPRAMPTEVTLADSLELKLPNGIIKIKTHKKWTGTDNKALFVSPELIRERWAVEEKYDIHKDLENL